VHGRVFQDQRGSVGPTDRILKRLANRSHVAGTAVPRVSRSGLELNQPAEAIRVTREWAGLSRGNAADLYKVACALALRVPFTRGTPQQALAAEAVQILKAAIAAGWNDAGKIRRDPNLAPLRDRNDFCGVLEDLFDRDFPAEPFVP
jgi:hypothetical protein